jgi:hypothetical protein
LRLRTFGGLWIDRPAADSEATQRSHCRPSCTSRLSVNLDAGAALVAAKEFHRARWSPERFPSRSLLHHFVRGCSRELLAQLFDAAGRRDSAASHYTSVERAWVPPIHRSARVTMPGGAANRALANTDDSLDELPAITGFLSASANFAALSKRSTGSFSNALANACETFAGHGFPILRHRRRCSVMIFINVTRDSHRLVDAELRFPIEARTQCLAVDEGHDVEQETVCLARIEQRKDVRGLSAAVVLISTTNRSAPRTAASSRLEDLDGDLSLVPEVVRGVHGRHAALAELALDTIAVSQGGAQA